MPPIDDKVENGAVEEQGADTVTGTIVDVPADTKLEPTAPAQPDDNVALAAALQSALDADEEAIAVAKTTEDVIAAAGESVKRANDAASAAKGKAQSLWGEFRLRLDQRLKRSPAGLLLLLAITLSMLVGCGASPSDLTNLRVDVRQNEQRLLDLERLDGKVATAAVNELRIALDKQTAQLQALVEAVEGQEIVTPWCPCNHGEVSPPLILPMPEDLPPPPKRVKVKPKEECSPP